MSSGKNRNQASKGAVASAHAPRPAEGLEMEMMERMESQVEAAGLGVPEDYQPPASTSGSRQAWSRDNPGFEPEDGLDANWSRGRRSLSDTSSSGSSGLGSFRRGVYPNSPGEEVQLEPLGYVPKILKKLRSNESFMI